MKKLVALYLPLWDNVLSGFDIKCGDIDFTTCFVINVNYFQ